MSPFNTYYKPSKLYIASVQNYPKLTKVKCSYTYLNLSSFVYVQLATRHRNSSSGGGDEMKQTIVAGAAAGASSNRRLSPSTALEGLRYAPELICMHIYTILCKITMLLFVLTQLISESS